MRNTLIAIIIMNNLSLPGLISNAWAYHTDNGRMMDENNHQIIIDGVNWAGFQDAGFVDELYGTIPFYSLAKPYQPQIPAGLMDLLKNPGKFSDLTNVKETNSVSFKTIRLPINPNNLHDSGINNHFRMDLTDARNKASGNGPFCKIWNDTDCTQPLSITESLYQIMDEFKKTIYVY
ncbi:hypothetical protein [Aquicella siphonis]|nr:hypothetical protein [Aquicella siphonis]